MQLDLTDALPNAIIRDVYFLRPVLVFEITKTPKFPVKFDLKLGGKNQTEDNLTD